MAGRARVTERPLRVKGGGAEDAGRPSAYPSIPCTGLLLQKSGTKINAGPLPRHTGSIELLPATKMSVRKPRFSGGEYNRWSA